MLFLNSQVVRSLRSRFSCSASSLRYSMPLENCSSSAPNPICTPPASRVVSAPRCTSTSVPLSVLKPTFQCTAGVKLIPVPCVYLEADQCGWVMAGPPAFSFVTRPSRQMDGKIMRDNLSSAGHPLFQTSHQDLMPLSIPDPIEFPILRWRFRREYKIARCHRERFP